MNRKKILILSAIAVCVAVVGGLILYMILDGLLLTPSAELSDKIRQKTDVLETLLAKNAKESSYKTKLKNYAGRAFEMDALKAKELSRAHLAELVSRSGLAPENTSLAPLGLAEKAGFYTEVGWNLKTRGSLESVTSLLYLLNAEPYLCRVDNIVVTPIRRTTEVDLALRYSTLVVEPQKGEKFTASQPSSDPTDMPSLDGPERARYSVIATRDLFRPYMQRPPQPSANPMPAEVSPPPAPAGPQDARFRVVGLPSYGSRPEQVEVCVTDSQGGEPRTYHLGDMFEGFAIVLVDYRPLPMPENPEIIGASRVILREGEQYYSLELGETLDRRRPLSEDRRPPQLPSPPPATPASGPAEIHP